MKLTGYNIIATVIALVVATGMTSCRKELCYNHFRNAAISLSWEREWERDYGESHASKWEPSEFGGLHYDDIRPGVPEWVRLVKYQSDGSMSDRFLEPDGGDLIMDENDYSGFLLYNGDTEYLVVSDVASLADARASATTRTRATLSYISEQYPGIRSTNPPDILYSAFISDFPHVELHESKDVPVTMRPLVYTYVIRYEFEEGQEYIALARGALAGMAESVFMRDGRTSDQSAIILYDCDVTDYGCEARVNSFGVPGLHDQYFSRSDEENEDRTYTLNLEVLLTNTKTVEFNIDVTDQIRNQPRGGVIRVSGLKFEEGQTNLEWVDSGFDPDILDWQQQDVIEINLEVSVPHDDQ